MTPRLLHTPNYLRICLCLCPGQMSPLRILFSARGTLAYLLDHTAPALSYPLKERDKPFPLLVVSLTFGRDKVYVISHAAILQELTALFLNLNLGSFFFFLNVSNSFVTYPKLFIYGLCLILKITYRLSSASSEKFDTNECKIARQSYISYQNDEKKLNMYM